MGKEIKKGAAVLAIAALTAGAFGACGGKTTGDDTKTIESEQMITGNDVTDIESNAAGKKEDESTSLEQTKQEETKKEENQEETVVEGFVDKIVVADTLPIYKDCGKIEEITYKTKDYYGDESEIEKKAFVYLPKDYSEDKKYNVLFLMHGIGGSEREWEMTGMNSKVKAMMDHLTNDGVIEPFIIVTPNGRSSKDFANTNADYNSFYVFGKELRNDLIPYMDSHYSTYADYDENGYDLTAARDHRAMAGLSMGGMQTTNIGMCECLDIMSYFGAFSAAPTTYPASQIAEKLKNFEEYNINYYYAICGRQDGTAYNPAHAAANGLPNLTDKLTDGENFKWQEVKGQHDFNVWYLGFYNFARIVFK